MLTDSQVRNILQEYEKTQNISQTSKRMGVARKTVRKSVLDKRLPSERPRPQRSWRTRADPFKDDWPFIEERLLESTDWEATTLFALLQERRPGHYKAGSVRSLQRRLRSYRAQQGPDQEVFFAQEHIPGERMQTDFTHVDESVVTIQGAAFAHLLCHSVLPYSNAEFATVCQSESLMALFRGLSHCFVFFGKTTKFSQTDNSTAATHRVDKTRKKREFNKDYLRFCAHYGVQATTIAVGKKEQNGDVESSHRHFKRAIGQALLVRGSNDFESVADYEAFVQNLCKARNDKRERLEEELSAMTALSASPWPEYRSYSAKVGNQSTVRVLANTYSVPSRLIGHSLTLHVYEYRVDAYLEGKLQMSSPRLLGKYQAHIDYRHIVGSLLQKPGAFMRYRYQASLFPSLVFRKAYDTLSAKSAGIKTDLTYIRILHHAKNEGEAKVEGILDKIMRAGAEVSIDALKKHLGQGELIRPPAMEPVNANLEEYDALLALGAP